MMQRLFTGNFDWLMQRWLNATLHDYLALVLAVIIVGYFISRLSESKPRIFR